MNRFIRPLSPLWVLPLIFLGCGDTSPRSSEAHSTSAEALTQGEQDARITAKWTALGGAATVGTALGSPAELPNGVGRYQRFTNGVIVWSNDYDTVLLPTAIFNYWIGLTATMAVEDPSRTQFDYIGLPKTTSDSPANVDTVAWDAKVNFERGIVGSKGGQIYSVQGNIFGRYALNPAKWGLPTNQTPHTGMTQLTHTWFGQVFTGGEIWARGNPTAGFTTVELINGGVFNTWTANPSFADPTGSIVDDGQGNQIGTFQGGDIYSSTAGTFGVPSQPDDGSGHSLLSVYLADGGPKGWLGYPSGPSGTSPGGATYSQFQNGLLVMYPNGGGGFFTPAPFGTLSFVYDWAQDTGSTGCFGTNPFGAGCIGISMGPFMSTTMSAYVGGSSTPIAQGTWPGPGAYCKQQTAGVTMCEEDGVFCDGSQQQINSTVPLGVASATTGITVDLTAQGYSDDCPGSASNSETGHLTLQLNIDNEWGANLPRTVPAPDAGDFKFTSHIKNDFPYDHNDWRGELWWSFHNFDTDIMPVQTYADTFVGVPNNFHAVTNWGDGLYYELVYKKSAASGNCFGMALDSIDAQFANRTAYDEPIHQWFTGSVDTQNGRSLDPTQDPAEADLGHELNVKFGYQLGVDSINYVLENYLGAVLSPSSVLNTVASDLASNGHPILSIATNLLFQDGHAIRPYRVGPSGVPCTSISGSTCTRLYVLDPNIPSANSSQEAYVEFSADNRWAYAPSDNNGLVYPSKNYSGSMLSGGRIMSMPYSVLDHQPTTPIAELGELLAAAAIIIVGDNAGVNQVTDEQGRTLYTTPNLGAAPQWSDLASGPAAIGNVTPIPLSDTGAGSPQIFASRAPLSVHQYDIGLAQNQPNGTPYTVAFLSGLASTAVTVPGSTGVPDRVTLSKLGTQDKSVAFMVPSNGVAKQITWTLSGADKSRQMVLGGLAVQPAQQLTTILENGASRLKIENAGPTTSGTLSLGNSTTPPVSTGTLNIPTGESGVDCSWTGATPTCVTMPPEEGSIFGFESGSAWSPAKGGNFFPTTIVTSPKTQGNFALAIGFGQDPSYRPLDSVKFSTSILQGVTSKLALDVYVPNGPINPGWVKMYATCESAEVFKAFLGEMDLKGQPAGAFATGTFNIPPSVLAALTTAHNDFFFTIAVNSTPASQLIVLDNLRFVP
jgi:hypothetical protein